MSGPVALVTGATSGIGEAAALALRDRGFTVYAAGRRLDRLAALSAERLIPLELDVTNEASCVSAVERIIADQAVGVEATGPNTSPWSRSTARSAIASPPSASITARSVAVRPGSCPVPRGRNGLSVVEYAVVRPVASARSASKRAPACPTTPEPSADTWSLGREPIPCTQKVPSVWTDRTPRQGSSSQLRRHFRTSAPLPASSQPKRRG